MSQPSLKVLIASDHAGVELKSALKKQLPTYVWEDLGPDTAQRVDYPDYAQKLSQKLASGDAHFGVLICGSGIGMCIAANKIHGIRAAVVENPVAAELARAHNDANVLCLGARFLAAEYAAEITQRFLETAFSQDSRHSERVKKIMRLEKGK